MWKRSFEIGATRLRERIPVSDPITLAEEARIAAHLDDRLESLYSIIDRHEPHLLIGSVAENVVRKAPCPVLTIPTRGHDFVTI